MDLNAEIAKAGVELVADYTKTLIAAGYDVTKDELQKISVIYGNAFKKYIDRNAKKFQKIKTILDPSTPVALLSIFEPPKFKVGDEEVDHERYIEWIVHHKSMIVTGLGGSGKSVFLKYTCLHCAKAKYNKIPVFVELRNVKKGGSLQEEIFKQINLKDNIQDVGFMHALQTGRFIFLLDAFDEIDEENRLEVGAEIKELAYKYDENIFFLSSRPNEEFKEWDEFQVSEICAFSKKQVLSLVERLKYEAGAKTRFSDAVEKFLYNSHQAYLSNPLLCIIMLMTFDKGAGIPEKQHLFFDLAFDVMFYKHDATKGGHYRRLFLTELSIDKFKSAFGSFSAFSYITKGSSFVRSDALDFAKQALAYDKIEKDAEDLISDINKRMCLLIKEGSRYSYIHRTFQEYFTAYFLSQRSFDGWDKVVHQIVVDKTNDNVIPMLRDMDGPRFDEIYLKPRLEEFLRYIASIDLKKNSQSVCQTVYAGFGLAKEPPFDLGYYSCR